MSKETVFLEKIMFKYLPEYFPTKRVRELALQFPKAFNVEHLTEIALAKIGGYDFVDAAGYDFTDYSDSKTATVASYDNCCAIGSVENKIGAIRLCVYNSYKEDVDFFFFSKGAVDRLKESNYGKNKHKERMRSSYAVYADTYSKFEPYRLNSFEELAQVKDDYSPFVEKDQIFSELFAA